MAWAAKNAKTAEQTSKFLAWAHQHEGPECQKALIFHLGPKGSLPQPFEMTEQGRHLWQKFQTKMGDIVKKDCTLKQVLIWSLHGIAKDPVRSTG